MEQLLAYVPYPIAAMLIDNPDRNPVGFEQRFSGVTLFADISGFTQLSESLARHGRSGTEELTVLLNTYFETVISLIHSYGGMVATFGGDSLAVLFPADQGSQAATARRAVQCAVAMQAAMVRYQAIPTLAGTFDLEMKVGLGYGPLLCTTVGDQASRLVYLIAGGALDRCVEAESQAGQGEIVAHSTLVSLAQPLDLRRERAGFGWIGGLDQPEPTLPLAGLPAPPPPTVERLRSYLHPAIVRRLETANSGFINEHRSVTIIFVRFQSFDYDGDHAVSAKLQSYLGQVIRIIQSYGGYLQQVEIGDKGSKYIALFGAPVTHENDLERALRCSLDLREAARAAGVPTYTGVNSGLVYCGLVGAASRQEYTVIGDAVNLAARLMQSSGADRIMVSQTTLQTASPTFRWQSLPALTVKGRSEPVGVAHLLGMHEQHAIRLQEPEYALPLVGREVELELVGRAIGQVGQRRGQIIGLTGDAGIGKSRLVAEILRLAEQAGLTSYGGECQSYATQTPYLVWQPIWRAFFALEAEWGLDLQRRVLEMQLTLINPALVERLPLLGRVFNLAWLDNDMTRALDSQLRKTLSENLLLDCLRSRASTTPLLIVLEDCHWIDPLSQDLLELVGRMIADLPVLLVVVFRPPEVQHQALLRLTGLPHYHEIRLADFTSAEAERLIANKLAQLAGIAVSLPPAVIERVIARAQGNPFYLEELLNYLHEQGADRQERLELEQFELPTSLQSLILSRIDQLTEHEQLTLKVASIIGRMFKASLLWDFYPPLGDSAQIKADLESLSRLDLTPLDSAEPELIYLFKHIVTHEVAYESLAYSTRTRLHDLFAEFVELTATHLEQHVDLLAYHYGRGQNIAKQREYLRRAGAAAQTVYANAAAITYYRRLLPLLSEPEQIPVLLDLARILELVGDWDAAEELYQQVAALARQGDAPLDLARCHYALGGLQRKRGDYQAALALLEQAQAEFAVLEDLAGLSQTLAEIGHVHRQQGSYPAARSCFELGLHYQRQTNDQAGIAGSLGNLGITVYAQGDYQTATEFHSASLAIRRELGDKLGIATALNGLGIVAYAQASYPAAHRFFAESLDLRRDIGDKLGITNCLNNLGVVAFEQGDYPTARTFYEESLDLRREVGNKGGIANSLNNLGYVALSQGLPGQAADFLRESLLLNADLGNQQGMAEALAGLAWMPIVAGPTAAHLEWSAQLCGAVQRLLTTINGVLEPTERAAYERAMGAAQEQLDATTFGRAWTAGQTQPQEQLIQLALADPGRAA